MKKLLLLTALFAFTFVACSKDDDNIFYSNAIQSKWTLYYGASYNDGQYNYAYFSGKYQCDYIFNDGMFTIEYATGRNSYGSYQLIGNKIIMTHNYDGTEEYFVNFKGDSLLMYSPSIKNWTIKLAFIKKETDPTENQYPWDRP